MNLNKYDNNNDIIKLFNNVSENKEFECLVYTSNDYTISYTDYLNCIEFLSKRGKHFKQKIESLQTLDIGYFNKENNSNYRITLKGIDTINKYMKLLSSWKNHVIFNVLVDKYFNGEEKEDNIEIIQKIKSNTQDNLVDVSEYNLRFRLSDELLLNNKNKLPKIPHIEQHNITFRYKERFSNYILDENNKYIKIDLTKITMTKNIKTLDITAPRYELEVEYMNKSNKNKKEDYEIMIKEVELLLKVIDQSNFILSKTDRENVLLEYCKIFNVERSKIQNLQGRKAVSLEIQYLTENLPNRFAVTDKADGERVFIIIVDNKVYTINSGLHVRYTGIEIDKKLINYNGSVLDCENIFLPKKNRHIIMAFDCLFNGKQDIRKLADFNERLKQADDIINNCFIDTKNKQIGYIFKEFDFKKEKEFSINKICDFYVNEIKKYMENLNNDIDQNKKVSLIRRKFFISPTGVKQEEIFKYSTLMWEKYTEDANVNCPYLLDGLIYHPLNQAYVTSEKDSVFFEYKWKPPQKNSIDLYVSFEKDQLTGKILNVYDNSVNTEVVEGEVINKKNKQYRILNLYAGRTIDNKIGEEPYPFREEDGLNQVYLYVEDGEVRDVEGKIINDKTVVEFYYNDSPEINPKFRFIPLRTRYDKTEAVIKYKRNYGNYFTVANRVWRTILNPILMSDMKDLGMGGSNYDRKIEYFRSKIGKELIISSNKENAYYTVSGDLAKPMRNFHNWLKSNLIYTHCHYMYQNKRPLKVLDIGCGRGGDIMKYYYANIDFLVGIDPSKDGIINSFNGAISRYNNFKKGKPRFPKMDFFQGVGGALLNYDDQFRALGSISHTDKLLMEKYFSKDSKKQVKFDRISCQFSIHYMFESNDTFNNFKKNINDYLAPGGYLIATCFDAEKVNELFGETEKFSSYYTDSKGNKKLLWQIIKKYNKLDKNEMYGVGNAIDFFGAWMFQEGQYQTEYLVDKKFIESEFLKDCDLELIDTDFFDNQFALHKEFITKYSQYESEPKTRKFMQDVKEYYENNTDDINKGCLVNDSITRYYVFRKKDTFNINKKIISQKGGNNKIDLFDENKFSINKFEKSDYTLFRSIHDILKTHNIIPKNESVNELFTKLNIKIPSSKKNIVYDINNIQNIANKIIIEHNIEDKKTKKIIDGLSIYLVDKDGNITKPEKQLKNYILLYFDNNNFNPIYSIEIEQNNNIKMKRAIF